MNGALRRLPTALAVSRPCLVRSLLSAALVRTLSTANAAPLSSDSPSSSAPDPQLLPTEGVPPQLSLPLSDLLSNAPEYTSPEKQRDSPSPSPSHPPLPSTSSLTLNAIDEQPGLGRLFNRGRTAPKTPRQKKLSNYMLPSNVHRLADMFGVPEDVALRVVTALEELPRTTHSDIRVKTEHNTKIPPKLEQELLDYCKERGIEDARKAFHEISRALVGYGDQRTKYDPVIIKRLLLLAWNEGKKGDSFIPAGISLITPCKTYILGQQISFLSKPAAQELYLRLLALDVPEAHLAMALFLYHKARTFRDAEWWGKPGVHREGTVSTVRKYMMEETVAKLKMAFEQSKDMGVRSKAAVYLGDHYATGEIVPRDPEKAMEYWRGALLQTEKGVFNDHAFRAAWFLGMILIGRQPAKFGSAPFAPVNKEAGFKLLEIASNSYGEAGMLVGRAFLFDPLDPATPSVEAHVQKYGVRPDNERAAKAFTLAMKKGRPAAAIRLAEMLIMKKTQPPEGMRITWTAPDGSDDPVLDRTRLETLMYAKRLVAPFCEDGREWSKFTKDVPPWSPVRTLKRRIGDIFWAHRRNPTTKPKDTLVKRAGDRWSGHGDWSSASYEF